MNQKQIMLLVAKWLNLSEILQLTEFGGTVDSHSDVSQTQLADLSSCVNLVVEEIACDYFPLLTEERVTASDEKIYYQDLSKPILKVFSLKNSHLNVPYQSFPNYIKTDYSGLFELTYSFAPTAPNSISQPLEIVGAPLTPRIVAYGVAREYCIYKCLYDQADYYNARFTSSLENIMLKKSSMKLPKRRWI